MSAVRRLSPSLETLPLTSRRRSEPKSLALLVDVVLARYGILPLDAENRSEPARKTVAVRRVPARRGEQTLLFPVG